MIKSSYADSESEMSDVSDEDSSGNSLLDKFMSDGKFTTRSTFNRNPPITDR